MVSPSTTTKVKDKAAPKDRRSEKKLKKPIRRWQPHDLWGGEGCLCVNKCMFKVNVRLLFKHDIIAPNSWKVLQNISWLAKRWGLQVGHLLWSMLLTLIRIENRDSSSSGGIKIRSFLNNGRCWSGGKRHLLILRDYRIQGIHDSSQRIPAPMMLTIESSGSAVRSEESRKIEDLQEVKDIRRATEASLKTLEEEEEMCHHGEKEARSLIILSLVEVRLTQPIVIDELLMEEKETTVALASRPFGRESPCRTSWRPEPRRFKGC
ncbi:hypothetical protein ACLOJK_011995 [Asimina triloba]